LLSLWLPGRGDACGCCRSAVSVRLCCACGADSGSGPGSGSLRCSGSGHGQVPGQLLAPQCYQEKDLGGVARGSRSTQDAGAAAAFRLGLSFWAYRRVLGPLGPGSDTAADADPGAANGAGGAAAEYFCRHEVLQYVASRRQGGTATWPLLPAL
ncbi:hypothetical protein BBK36DRAFT_1192182, partial [Trichoderma citrinoviride]